MRNNVSIVDMVKWWPILFCLLVFACTPFTPAKRDTAPVEIPNTYSLYSHEISDNLMWWELFGDDGLNGLVETAIEDNFSIREMWARLKQVHAVTIQSGATLYPDLGADADARYLKAHKGSGQNEYGIGMASSYELDLWGRIRSEQDAASLAEQASMEDINTAAMTLSAEVTRRWLLITGQKLEIDLLEKQLGTNLIFLELIELRFRKAMVSALDVYQQKQVVENVRAEIPLAKARRSLWLNELAVLLGNVPGKDIPFTAKALPKILPVPPVGFPCDLLANRPDIRAAGLRLRAADFQLAAARADRLPAIRLTAGVSLDRTDVTDLFDNWLVNLAANLTAPILDGGFRAAEVEKKEALIDENVWAYGRTIISAIKDVEDAMVNETAQRAHIEAIEKVYTTARAGLDQALQQYRNGLIDYLPVLTQLLSVQKLQRSMISEKVALLLYRTDLHRALGGAWVGSLSPAGLQKK